MQQASAQAAVAGMPSLLSWSPRLVGAAGRRWQADPHAAHDCCHVVNKQSSLEGGNHVLPLKEALVT